ncbi:MULTISPECIES: type II secretion system minor pseudopilin GspH [unclassified Colwellia]|jgi:general secretion pathway protein H|uniref:type II secretion system minor pseudopilin GspH n=1 Tax=unclassified Colwellia TaxID=196834 RepID=UPI0015F3A061|nr:MULTISPECIES: type II secretion system minor pseudopilin GspH [unclassified Colwellia]MBA6337964.1 type II secretion system minor pseudopilin GspH [Colwellia sp. BRX8-7]MBA6346877.1 type II secretion system minor pseudopilin GspH [Colwellia sp. BRX8-9]MBA6380499.1 type II secretion system minor pseudopilin GspH [Colwellia sp. BRX10-7]MBA6386366.1 type II secretion system minor pseudopilin GspH [Colwellia sp. BRX10-2]MBA6402234.1 type II secretion system minor pseudopilin GspH [Colwellia sp.
MKHYSKNSTVVNGFTLIEVMLVIVLVGLMVSVVQFSASGDKAEETLELSSKRFAGVFNIAAEYGMLNNIELGLVIGKKGYQFLGYDGITWSDISDNELFSRYKLPEGVELILQLDDLPIEEPQLFDTEVFNELQAANKENDLDEDVAKDDDGNNIEKKILIPQIYILSGGEITPFSLRFQFVKNNYTEAKLYFKATGLYTTPITVEGPLFDDE